VSTPPFVFPPRKDIIGSKMKRTGHNGSVEYAVVMDCFYVEALEAKQHAGWKLLMRDEKTGIPSTWTIDEEPNRAHHTIEFVTLDATGDDLSSLTSGEGLWNTLTKGKA
jgi:isoaspartyl peptidase/L-asparaginase-like protein (Ntn-hydrolase superfamily)